MAERFVFKEFRFECGGCGQQRTSLQWDYDPPPVCCGEPTTPAMDRRGNAAAVHGDEIDIVIKHGPVHEDGSPRRYRSRAELAREEKRLGWTKLGETPNPAGTKWF
jgi:hypothetical protein